jgi:hypothetical protein
LVGGNLPALWMRILGKVIGSSFISSNLLLKIDDFRLKIDYQKIASRQYSIVNSS